MSAIKYYYAGATRIAMKIDIDPTQSLLSDHLGSTSRRQHKQNHSAREPLHALGGCALQFGQHAHGLHLHRSEESTRDRVDVLQCQVV